MAARRGPALCALVQASVLLGSGAAGAADGPPDVRPRADVVLVGPKAADDGVRTVVTELLERQGFRVSWSCATGFQPRDLLAGEEAQAGGATHVWMDMSTSDVVHLYFRDAGATRFFIRSLPLTRGVDELAREEAAQIVASTVLALSTGSGDALTRSEARVALKVDEAVEVAPPVPQAPGPAPRRALVWRIAMSGGAQLLSSEIPVAAVLVGSLALTRGCFGGWIDAGLQIPAEHEEGGAGVALWAASLRAGLLVQGELGPAIVLRAGAGAGVDRVSFEPRGDAAALVLAPGGAFLVPVVSLRAGVDIPLSVRLAVTASVLADVALQHVHFDVHDATGASTRVVSLREIRPGASVGMAFRF